MSEVKELRRALLSARIFAGLAAFLDTVINFLIAIPLAAILLWSFRYLHFAEWGMWLTPFFVAFVLWRLRKYMKDLAPLKGMMEQAETVPEKPEGTDA